MNDTSSGITRHCLVTVGATVGFQDLTKAALQPSFWSYLRNRGFTALRIQCGPDISWAENLLSENATSIPPGMTVNVLDISRNLMQEEMVLCKPNPGQRSLGLVISHTGTGTILDAWKLGLPLVVVPNTRLMDDHQTELAEHLSNEGYAIRSTTQLEHLKDAVDKVDLLWQENKSRWPPNDPGSKQADGPVSIWSIRPTQVQQEEEAQMTHD